jgi:hypothetical protein
VWRHLLSERQRRKRIELNQDYHADLPEQFEGDWYMPAATSDLAFIERRLYDFDQNKRRTGS